MPRSRRSWTDDRGASLALIAISLVWIVGLASLVIDVSSGWLDRQQLIPATDAAALAAAQEMIDRPWDQPGACATARTYVADNAPESTMIDCAVTTVGADGGRVIVSAREPMEGLLTDVATSGRSVHSASTATWGWPRTVRGLRPLGLCYDGSAALKDLIDNPPTGPTWVYIPFFKEDPEACGGLQAAGNYATIDFDGGTPMHEIRDWAIDGYPGQIGFDPAAEPNCDSGAGCYDRPYASNDIRPELYELKHRQSYEPWPVFDYSDNDYVHLVGMVRARLYAFDISGPFEDWFIELKVDPGVISGTCCGGPAGFAGSKTVVICGVDRAVDPICETGAGP